MRITESQLRKIIREVLDNDEWDLPYFKEDWDLPHGVSNEEEFLTDFQRKELSRKRYKPEPPEKIGPDYRLPSREPVTDLEVYGGYKLYSSPAAAFNTIAQAGRFGGSYKNILVHRDPKTGKYWGRLKPGLERY